LTHVHQLSVLSSHTVWLPPDLQIELEPGRLAIAPRLDPPRGRESVNYGQSPTAFPRRFALGRFQIRGRVRIVHLDMEAICPDVEEKCLVA
jgi:hypothetical protein